MIFLKEHLTGTGYEWNLGENIRSSRETVPTRRRFDRFNGNCVLHMLNLFNALVESLSIRDGQQLEVLIANELPLTESSEISVFNWLKKVYSFAIRYRLN
jgi:hypothetical protein